MELRVSWDWAQLVFVHVPKAGGTSLSRMLERRFARREICPAYYWPELLRIPRRELLRYRLIRGHFDYCVVDLLRDVRVITVLRDPVSRAVSYYRYIRSSQHHPLRDTFRRLGFREVLGDPELGRPIRDEQTRLFGRDVDLEEYRRRKAPDAPPVYPWENRPGGSEVSVERAMERLEQMAFVGIQERFEDSLLLLAYTFGWPPPRRVVRVNVTPEAEDDPSRDPEVAAAIREANPMDGRLYRHACSVFQRRFEAMRAEVATELGIPQETVGRREMERVTARRARRRRRG